MRGFKILVCAALLTGCVSTGTRQSAGSPMPPTSFASGYDTPQIAERLRAQRLEVANLVIVYDQAIKNKQVIQTSFDSSLIALATGSIAAAYYNAAAGWLGGIGIAAGSLSAYRSYYDPEGQGAAYIKAKNALQCIYDTSEPLEIADAKSIKASLEELGTGIAEMKASVGGLPAGAAEGADAANTAISAAEAAEKALKIELEAYTLSPSTVALAHNAVVSFIDQRKHRGSVDLASAQQTVTSGITSATAAATQAAEARTKLLEAVKATATEAAETKAAGATVNAMAGPPGPAAAQKAVQLQALAARATNTMAASDLIRITENALRKMPSPQYTVVKTQIAACATGL